MTKVFYKKTNNVELNILLSMKTWKEKNLFLPLLTFNSESQKMGIRKMAYDIQKARKMKTWNVEVEEKCILKISEAINALRNHYVLHQDVHLKNIVCNKSFSKFYLVDFNVSVKKPYSIMNLYEKQCFLYREDQFQLFWNFIFGHNKFVSDFTSFRKKLRRSSPKTIEKLKQKSKIFFMKHYIDNIWEIFLSKEAIHIKEKENQIVFKFFLTRLYLLHFIYIDTPNPFYQSLLTRVKW